jgi:hypothetical protein
VTYLTAIPTGIRRRRSSRPAGGRTPAVAGRRKGNIQVCSADYGDTGWPASQIWVSLGVHHAGDHEGERFYFTTHAGGFTTRRGGVWSRQEIAHDFA